MHKPQTFHKRQIFFFASQALFFLQVSFYYSRLFQSGIMKAFHIDLDDTGQTVVDRSRRHLFLLASVLLCVIALAMIVFGALQGPAEAIFCLLNAGLYLFMAVISFQLWRGKNIISLSLGNFFSVSDYCIRYRFSAFSRPKEICWHRVRFAEIRLYTVFLWIGDTITEINLEEIRHLPTRQLIKDRLRFSLNAQHIHGFPSGALPETSLTV